jgi:hypothetical protein
LKYARSYCAMARSRFRHSKLSRSGSTKKANEHFLLAAIAGYRGKGRLLANPTHLAWQLSGEVLPCQPAAERDWRIQARHRKWLISLRAHRAGEFHQ